MALPSKYSVDKKINSMEGLSAYENGGKGSGNFGHAGRPGERGGSGKGDSKTLYGVEAYKAIADSHDRAKAQDEKVAEQDRKEISQELDDFAGFGGYSRRDELKTIGAGLENLTTDIKSAKEAVSRGAKREDRARALLRIGEAEKAIREADRLLKDKDFIKGVGDAKKTLLESARVELKRGKDFLSDYYKQMDEN